MSDKLNFTDRPPRVRPPRHRRPERLHLGQSRGRQLSSGREGGRGEWGLGIYFISTQFNGIIDWTLSVLCSETN